METKIIKKIEEIRERINSEMVSYENLIASDPFYFYQPSDGNVSIEGRKILEKYLKPEDIPQGKLDGQLDVHLSCAPIRGASGGNQSGKSTVGCIDCLIDGTGLLPISLRGNYPEQKLPKRFPRYFRYVTVDYTTLLNTVLPTFRYWTPKEFLIDGDWDKSYKEEGKEGQRLLKLGKNGVLYCTIEFMTNEMKVQKFQGPPRHKVVYDEEPREDIYKENLMRFTTAERLDLLFCWTPTNGLSWATELFDEEREENDTKVELYKLCSVTNKMANMQVLEKILREITDYEELRMRLLGEFVSLSGLVYGKLFNTRVHLIEPFKVDRNMLVCIGIDPHLVTPTAAVFLGIDRNGNKYVLDSYYKAVDTQDFKTDIAEIFKERNWRPGWSVADKSSNSTIIAFGGRNIFQELKRPPNPIHALRESVKYEGSIKAGVDEIKKALKIKDYFDREGKLLYSAPELFICNTPGNRPLIQAFKTLERDTFPNEENQGMKDKIKEGKHHLHAALRYLFQYPLVWYPEMFEIPQYQMYDEAACY